LGMDIVFGDNLKILWTFWRFREVERVDIGVSWPSTADLMVSNDSILNVPTSNWEVEKEIE